MNIFRVRGEEYVQLKEAYAGDIVAIQGIKNSVSGDTLLDAKDDSRFILEELELPNPIFS